jgi:hypothetical protein
MFDEVDLTVNQTSSVSHIQNLDNIGIMISTTGVTDNDGMFKVQVSNDKEVWADIPFLDNETQTFVTAIGLADADVVLPLSLTQVGFTYLRLVFEAGTGTDGVATATISAKQL